MKSTDTCNTLYLSVNSAAACLKGLKVRASVLTSIWLIEARLELSVAGCSTFPHRGQLPRLPPPLPIAIIHAIKH